MLTNITVSVCFIHSSSTFKMRNARCLLRINHHFRGWEENNIRFGRTQCSYPLQKKTCQKLANSGNSNISQAQPEAYLPFIYCPPTVVVIEWSTADIAVRCNHRIDGVFLSNGCEHTFVSVWSICELKVGRGTKQRHGCVCVLWHFFRYVMRKIQRGKNRNRYPKQIASNGQINGFWKCWWSKKKKKKSTKKKVILLPKSIDAIW